MKKAILYLRLRSDKDPATSRTLHKQEKQLRNYCTAHGIDIAGVYRENLLSGNTGFPLFKKAVTKLKRSKNELSLLMFRRWNKTSTMVWHTAGMTEKFTALNVQATLVEPGIELIMIKQH